MGLRRCDENPYGGLAEYMLAPQYSLVKIPDNLSFEAASRFGYVGTAYSAMRKAGVGAGSSILVNGISGTLGIGGALFGLAMGDAHPRHRAQPSATRAGRRCRRGGSKCSGWTPAGRSTTGCGK